MAPFGRARRTMSRLGERFLPSGDAPSGQFRYAMLSHPGRVRRGNEDTCAADPAHGVFAVCDGMGGAAAGEVASRLAADTLVASLAPPRSRTEVPALRRPTPDIRMDEAIHAANAVIYQRAMEHPELRGMGTTLVALLLELPVPDEPRLRPSLTLAHVGDSRCYLFRAGQLVQLTEDHSLVEEQLRSGQITALEAERHPMRNIITRAVGSQPVVEPELMHLDPQPGDLLLLASDGLTRELSDSAILTVLLRAQHLHGLRKTVAEPFLNLPSICQTLVDEANDAGGMDNITVLLLQLA